MEEVAATPLPVHVFKAGARSKPDIAFSSSPGFATPAQLPNRNHGQQPATRPVFAPNIPDDNLQTILPILLPPQTLRPVAFRTLTKKHNLTITSSGLGALAIFVGRYCGEGWRSDGLAERVLDEVAKLWKRDNGGLILDDSQDKKLKTILKSLESCISGGRIDQSKLGKMNSSASLSRSMSSLSRPDMPREDSQSSFGMSALEVEDAESPDHDFTQDARAFLKIVSAFQQPRLAYSTTKKSLELVTSNPSLLPPIQHRIAAFRNRFHLVHQRLLRNESFQTTTFSRTTGNQAKAQGTSATAAYKITPISNLLGRSGSAHLLLGALVHSATGELALSDLTGSTILDLSVAKPVPDDNSWFCPGMIVLIEGTYEDDGSNASGLGAAGGVGGQIKGKFNVDTIAGPPAERRDVTLGTGHNHKIDAIHTVAGAGYGWIDFLGVGSERAMGQVMRRIQSRVLSQRMTADDETARRSKMIMIGECNLDNPRSLDAIRAILKLQAAATDVEDRPLCVVLFGNFVSSAAMAGSSKGADSIQYKEAFDNLAGLLSEFPSILSCTTFVFIPGDNDPWASAFSAGASTLLPRQGVPDLFTSRIRRAFTTANNDSNHKKNATTAGEAIFTSNPARMSLFGPVEEIVLFRDDITSRIRRNAVLFPKHDDPDDGLEDENDVSKILPDDAGGPDMDVEAAVSRIPIESEAVTYDSTKSSMVARRLTKLLLDQSHLVPFPPSTRPTLWDYSHSLNLYPLPTALCICDAEAPPFCITYEGCHVVNPGNVIGKDGFTRRRGGGSARWVEYDVMAHRGLIRETRF